MTANAERGQHFGRGRRLSESRPIRHKRGGSNHALLVRLLNGAVYARSKSEIIGDDDEAAHAESLAGRAGCCIPQGVPARLTAVLKLTYTRTIAIRADAPPHPNT